MYTVEQKVPDAGFHRTAMAFLNEHFPRLNAVANAAYRAVRLYHANRSLRALITLGSHVGCRLSGQQIPHFITIDPTYRCQCRCVHCCASAADRETAGEMTGEELKSVIDQAKELGVLQITFSGGEPLLREDIVDLVRHAHDIGLLTRINTNGLLLEPALIRELERAGLCQCAVSIDDADPATHDSLRGLPGLHEKAVAGIQNLRESRILCQINTYASRRNITRGLERIIALGRELGVLAVYIIYPVRAGCWQTAPEQVLNEGERARVRALQEVGFVHLELPTRRSRCPVSAKSVLFVSPQGNVTPCPFVPYVIGSVKDRSLSELWHRYARTCSLECRGACIMNDDTCRKSLETQVRSASPTEPTPPGIAR